MLELRSDSVSEARVQRDNVVGYFCGLPIVTIDEINAEADEEADLIVRLMLSSHQSIDAEILPGEERCADGIIRRSTTAEAVGYDKYHSSTNDEAKSMKKGGIALGRLASLAGSMVYWRPNRMTLEVYAANTPLPTLKTDEPEPYVLIIEDGEGV